MTGFAPLFTAGTLSNAAGSFSPFVLSFSRGDSEQQVKGLRFTLPPGASAKLAGVPLCSDADAAAGTCPEASRIGSVTVGAGPGSDPFFLKGSVYLTGSYNGGPFGEVVVVPAIAGPFDLGNVVVRGSIRIDPHTAQPTVVSDPFPQFVGSTGIPTDVRRVDVTLDRPGFTFNPTSCAELHTTGTLTSVGGASAAVSQRFQAADCASLPFKPTFTVHTQGRTSRSNGASLHVTVTSSTGQANIAYVHAAGQTAQRAGLLQGPHSALTASGSLCKPRAKLTMPTRIVGQNGAAIERNTKVAVDRCPKPNKRHHKRK